MGYKVWLERDGRRVIEPESGIPAKLWKALRAEIVKRRETIEDHWVALMMERGWLDLHVAGPLITLVAYPRLLHYFVRTIDLHDHFEDQETLSKITPSEVVFNKELAMLEVFPKRVEGRRRHIPLVPLLWT